MFMKNNILTVKKDACFGCSACMAICSADAIVMRADDEGFMSAVVDEVKCVECGLCMETCPALNRWDHTNAGEMWPGTENAFYAFQNGDGAVLADSTSGGAFFGLAGTMQNPFVCGCIEDEEHYVRHIITDKESEIQRMRGSKYVQSDMGDCFRQIAGKLDDGENVIFTGTSCQTHGLLNYLRISGVSSDRLLTADLICHGVPSNLLHAEYIKNYEAKKKARGGVTRHHFRTKRHKWGIYFMLRNYEQMLVRMDGMEDSKSLESQLWLNVFFSDLCLRECCYICPYCKEEKPADITMADFWGIEYTDIDLEYSGGCSLVIARGKGKHFVEKLENPILLNGEQSAIAKKYQLHLSRPNDRPALRDAFWNDYFEHGFEYVAKRYLRYSVRYKILMIAYNVFKRMKNKRIAQMIGTRLFY